jgi:hypothetical protein
MQATLALAGAFGLEDAFGARDEAILIFGTAPAECTDPFNMFTFIENGTVTCRCPSDMQLVGGACEQIPSEDIDVEDICELYGCGDGGDAPIPDPEPVGFCGQNSDVGEFCRDKIKLCDREANNTLAQCKVDLQAWATLQCKQARWPPGYEFFENILDDAVPKGAAFEDCVDGWKEETPLYYEVGIGDVTIGKAGSPGAARFSKCSDASAAAFMQCRQEVREGGCPDACFVEEHSGIHLTISPYDGLTPLPAGRPALATSIVADRAATREDAINKTGYRLLDKGRVEEAIRFFRWNAENFPDSANVYDSLGEAYMKAGDMASASRNYEKALRLDPERESTKRALDTIRNRPRGSDARPRRN